jgi:hypothetical protein
VAGSLFINLQSKRSIADFFESLLDPGFVFTHRVRIRQTDRFGIMLRFAETTIIPAHQYLNLFAVLSSGGQDVQVRVARETIKGGFELLAITD